MVQVQVREQKEDDFSVILFSFLPAFSDVVSHDVYETASGFDAGPGDMRRESHALRMLHLQVRMVLRNRFLNEDIDTGSSDYSIIDCLSKILLNDDRSPSVSRGTASRVGTVPSSGTLRRYHRM